MMLVYMQFVVSQGTSGTALAWPWEYKGYMQLTHEPLKSIGYGSEDVAIADLDRWLAKFPQIKDAEPVVFCSEGRTK